MAAMTEGAADSRERKARAGDRAALAGLYAEQEGRLRRWVENRLDPRLRGRLSASDVLQEIYLAAEGRLEHFGGLVDMPFSVWVRLLADQRLVEVHRKHLGAQARDAGREVSIGAGGGQGSASSVGLAARFAADLTSPSQAAVRKEAEELLAETIAAMEPLDREILTLRHFDELTNDEAARFLGVPKGTASKRYIRALERLRGVLESIPGLLDED